MKVTKCDLCDKEFSQRDYNLPFWNVRRDSIISIRDIKDLSTHKELDVCQNCVIKIREYITNQGNA